MGDPGEYWNVGSGRILEMWDPGKYREGKIYMSTGKGRIRASIGEGKIRVSTEKGRIRASIREGKIRVSTEKGRIRTSVGEGKI